MFRLLWFIIKLLAVVGLAIFVAENGGRVTLEWGRYVIETSVLVLAGAVLALVIVAIYTTKAMDAVGYTSRLIQMRGQLRRQRHGQELLADAMNAASLEKSKRAATLLGKAEKLLGRTAIVDVVRSHAEPAAIVAGPVAEFTSSHAWRAAIEQKMLAGNLPEARAMAERFAELNPGLALANRMLFDIYMRQFEFEKALARLDHLRGAGGMSRQELRNARAVLFAERARHGLMDGERSEAFEWAMQADRLRPSWVPALLQAVKALESQNRAREAAGLIERVWGDAAHRQLADEYLSLRTGKNALQKAQQAEKLAKKAPDHPATFYLLAKAYIGAELWGQARQYADRLVASEPSRAAYELVAATESEKGAAPSRLQELAKRAADAPPMDAWICKACHQPHAEWQAICTACNKFDTLAWEKPLYLK